jgi:hypothetical protein
MDHDTSLKRTLREILVCDVTPAAQGREVREKIKKANAEGYNPAVEQKECKRCGHPKLSSEFGDDQNSPDSLNKWCKMCKNKHAQARNTPG